MGVHKGTGQEGAIYAGLETLTAERLTRKYRRDDGAEMTIPRCLIDANWGNSTDVVYQFCRQSAHAALLMPSHGRYVGAASTPFADYKPKRGDRAGLHWRIPGVTGKRAVRLRPDRYQLLEEFCAGPAGRAHGRPGVSVAVWWGGWPEPSAARGASDGGVPREDQRSGTGNSRSGNSARPAPTTTGSTVWWATPLPRPCPARCSSALIPGGKVRGPGSSSRRCRGGRDEADHRLHTSPPGHQQLNFFHGHYEQYQYFPLIISEPTIKHVWVAWLRPGTVHAALGAEDDLMRVVAALRQARPDIRSMSAAMPASACRGCMKCANRTI